MSWGRENAETERTVKEGREASLEKQSFLGVNGFTNRKIFTWVLMALGFCENLRYLKVCSHRELFLWWSAESLL